MCVNGLSTLHRWAGSELLRRTAFEVPAIIVAYNNFISSVDPMDQLRFTIATTRKEARVEKTIFTLLLDLSVNNAFGIYIHIHVDEFNKITIREFKRKICEALVLPHRSRKRKNVVKSQDWKCDYALQLPKRILAFWRVLICLDQTKNMKLVERLIELFFVHIVPK